MEWPSLPHDARPGTHRLIKVNVIGYQSMRRGLGEKFIAGRNPTAISP
jgi:hypothetical protein